MNPAILAAGGAVVIGVGAAYVFSKTAGNSDITNALNGGQVSNQKASETPSIFDKVGCAASAYTIEEAVQCFE